MAHVKIINPAGWDFGRPIAQMIKVSSRGLIGQDRKDFIKLAGDTAPAFVDLIDKVKIAKDEVPVHLLALGASEAYGPNRNGDGFKEAHCIQNHKTFEKYAKWFRNHRNKLAENHPFYGEVKLAAYSGKMRRVELLVGLNAEKSAAERNGGFVADKELEKLARDEDIPVSMACRVPFDVCSGCEKQARTRDEYCTAATCSRGGCRDNLTKVGEDGHILHVDNPNPLWFDISNVYRPADRIAYGAQADWLSKAASARDFTPGAELADALGITAPLSVCVAQQVPEHWPEHIRGQVKIAMGLAALETDARCISRETLRAFDAAVQTGLSNEQLAVLGRPGTTKAAEALTALADHEIILPLRDFAKWIGKQAAVAAAAPLLPGVYRRMAETGQLEAATGTHPYAAWSTKVASISQRVLASNLFASYSLNAAAVCDRSMLSAMRTANAPQPKNVFWNEKQAADHPDAAELAEAYALYKLAALYRIASLDRDFNLTARLAVGQNRVC